MTEPADVPAALAPPPGTVLKMHDHGIGTQVYTCTASGGADAGADAGAVTYAWVLKGPDAVLYDGTFAQVGTHGAGPKWTSTDGSVISGQKLAQASAPAATAIPWPKGIEHEALSELDDGIVMAGPLSARGACPARAPRRAHRRPRG
ncbi:MAG: DUF3455 domain-containing protein [Pseudomonadota bacterium]